MLLGVFFGVRWRDAHGGKDAFDFTVPSRVHGLVRPHVQKADLTGFVEAHGKHDPVTGLTRLTRSTRRHGVGYGKEEGTGKQSGKGSEFPEHWEDDDRASTKSNTSGDYSLVGPEDDIHPDDVINYPAHPEPPSPPPAPISKHMQTAPGVTHEKSEEDDDNNGDGETNDANGW